MKGIFGPYVLWPLDKKLIFWIVTRVSARDFTVYQYSAMAPWLLFWYLRAWLSSQLKTQKFVCALASKEHTLFLSFLGPNNPPLSKFGSCLCIGLSVWHYIIKPLWLGPIPIKAHMIWKCSAGPVSFVRKQSDLISLACHDCYQSLFLCLAIYLFYLSPDAISCKEFSIHICKTRKNRSILVEIDGMKAYNGAG